MTHIIHDSVATSRIGACGDAVEAAFARSSSATLPTFEIVAAKA